MKLSIDDSLHLDVADDAALARAFADDIEFVELQRDDGVVLRAGYHGLDKEWSLVTHSEADPVWRFAEMPLSRDDVRLRFQAFRDGVPGWDADLPWQSRTTHIDLKTIRVLSKTFFVFLMIFMGMYVVVALVKAYFAPVHPLPVPRTPLLPPAAHSEAAPAETPGTETVPEPAPVSAPVSEPDVEAAAEAVPTPSQPVTQP